MVPLTWVSTRRPVLLAGSIPAEFCLDSFLGAPGKTREWEGCEALKLIRGVSLLFWSLCWEMISRGIGPWGRVRLKKARQGVTSGHWPLPSGLHPSQLPSPSVSSLLGDGCLLSFFFSIREDDSNTALGHQGVHKLVPTPANEEGKRGDWQAVSCGFGLWEGGRRRQLGPPLTPHSSEAQGLLPWACGSGFLKSLLFQASI